LRKPPFPRFQGASPRTARTCARRRGSSGHGRPRRTRSGLAQSSSALSAFSAVKACRLGCCFFATLFPVPDSRFPVFSVDVSRACLNYQMGLLERRAAFLPLLGGQNGPGASARGVGGAKC
jgi:hypothetical protein